MYLILSYLFDTLHPVRVVQYDAVVFPQYPIHQVVLRFGFRAEEIARLQWSCTGC